MYKISTCNLKLCHFLRHHLNLATETHGDKGDECEIYTIWSFAPKARWEDIKSFVADKPFCQKTWFPLVYWLVFLVSIFGSIHSLYEFVTLLRTASKPLSLWRLRKYHVLPLTLLRRCRLLGSLVTFNCWLMLCYAVVRVSPNHMTPWLTLNLLILVFETFAWIAEVFMGSTHIDFYSLFAFALPIVNYWFVSCVQRVFQKSIDSQDVDEVCLWSFGK